MHQHRSQVHGLNAKPAVPSRAKKLKDFLAFKLPQHDLFHAIEEFFIALDTPVSLSCLILFRHQEYRQLVEKEIDPMNYIDRFRFRDDFAAISLLRKNRFLSTGIDLKEVALDSFRSSEQQCSESNRRFMNLISDPLYFGQNAALLSAMTRKISRFLGDFDVDELLDRGSWGPGVTTLVKGCNLSASRKFREERGITRRAYHLFGQIIRMAYPDWIGQGDFEFSFQPGNKVITVPKNAKTDRTIAIEPGLNSWLQLGMGKILRRKLRLAGFDLNSDLRNQRSAYIGSIDDSLATVDFSSASDTIAYNVVREILPHDWFTVLDSLRSPGYTLNGNLTHYEKFSAMGNGFTFELESLIFVTAALVCCEYVGADQNSVSVFGDDIIIPKEAFALFSSFSSFLGFTVNQKKSYSSGPFRESCGSYYFDGLDVKPIFIKEIVKSAKATYRLVNSVRSLAHRRNLDCGCDARLLPVWKSLVRRLPKHIRAYGARDSGDSCIHVNFDEGCPTIAKDQWCGYTHPGFLTIPLTRHDDHRSLLLARLWCPSRDSASFNEVPLRAVTKICFRKHIFAARWYNWGPWY